MGTGAVTSTDSRPLQQEPSTTSAAATTTQAHSRHVHVQPRVSAPPVSAPPPAPPASTHLSDMDLDVDVDEDLDSADTDTDMEHEHGLWQHLESDQGALSSGPVWGDPQLRPHPHPHTRPHPASSLLLASPPTQLVPIARLDRLASLLNSLAYDTK